MALVRKAVNLSELKTVDFCGRPFTRSPLTRKEIEDAGFKSISLPNISLEEKWHKSVGKALKVGKALMVVSVPGTGKDVTIREMAETMKQVVSFKGKLTFDTTKPDGAPRKLIDVSRLSNMGWNYNIDLKEGLATTYEWYLNEI